MKYHQIFEISGDHIAQLDDPKLRELIGLLCEADYRNAGVSTSAVTWGGHQDAGDGGTDVNVCNQGNPPKNSFIPKSITGFQVKKSKMPPSDIRDEMRPKPKGVLRPDIANLIKSNGAYIIVSSGDSTTQTMLRKRIHAMKEAIESEENYHNFHVDFFDRGRIATWVRNYPSLILWVHNQIGHNKRGNRAPKKNTPLFWYLRVTRLATFNPCSAFI